MSDVERLKRRLMGGRGSSTGPAARTNPRRKTFWLASVPVYGNYELRCLAESEAEAKRCALAGIAELASSDPHWEWGSQGSPEAYWDYVGGQVQRYTLGKTEMV